MVISLQLSPLQIPQSPALPLRRCLPWQFWGLSWPLLLCACGAWPASKTLVSWQTLVCLLSLQNCSFETWGHLTFLVLTAYYVNVTNVCAGDGTHLQWALVSYVLEVFACFTIRVLSTFTCFCYFPKADISSKKSKWEKKKKCLTFDFLLYTVRELSLIIPSNSCDLSRWKKSSYWCQSLM